MRQAMMNRSFEIRSPTNGVLEGYPIVWNTRTTIGPAAKPYFTERIVEGAAVIHDHAVLLAGHEGLPLAGVQNDTLRLKSDDHGLRMQATLDMDDDLSRSIWRRVNSGLMPEMSFGFRVSKETWDDDADPADRTIEKMDVYEVSVVSAGAYPQTEVQARNRVWYDTAYERLNNVMKGLKHGHHP